MILSAMTDASIVTQEAFARAYTVCWQHPGGWLDLTARRLTAPPEGIVRAFQGLVRTDDFATLKSSVK
jgi:hypothetical protein